MQKHVEFVREGLTLRGMLHVPEGYSGKLPGIVIYHGFTGNKIEPHFLFVKLSRALEKAGIANVRFDFSGSGESDGNFSEMTPETELKDANAILDYFRKLEFIDSCKVGICGLSMGGYIGGITAGDRRDDVKSLCMWAPAGNMKDIFSTYVKDENKIGEGLYSLGGNILNAEALSCAASIDHIGRTAAFAGKTCIIHGTGDQTVPFNIGMQYRDAIKDVEFYPIDGADHTFNSTEWERKVIALTADFFSRTL